MLKKLIAWYKNRVKENDALREEMFEEKEEPEEQLIEEPEEYIPDISEPVLSFVETFRNNPRRFSISLDWYIPGAESYCGYTLKDRITGEEFSASVSKGWSWDGRTYTETWYKCPSFLTKDEWEYILESLSCYYKERDARLAYLRATRVAVMRRRERSRLTEIYKGGEDVGS